MREKELFNGYGGGNHKLDIAVALGRVPGWLNFRKFGINDAVTVGTEEIWPPGTLRVLPTSAAVASTVSSSIQDDADLVGTGAWTLHIEGLDENYLPVTEDITLNGTAAVVTTQTFIRINRAYLLTAGTGEINAGDISISVGGDLQAYIEANEGQTQQTNYTVPAGFTVLVESLIIHTGRMAGNTDLHVESEVKLFGDDTAWRAISNIYLYSGGTFGNDDTTQVLPEKTEIRQRIVTDGATQVNAIWSGFLIENRFLTRTVS